MSLIYYYHYPYFNSIFTTTVFKLFFYRLGVDVFINSYQTLLLSSNYHYRYCHNFPIGIILPFTSTFS